MTKRAKRLQKLFDTPKKISFEMLDTVLREQGYQCRQPRSGSSHYTYFKDQKLITVPYKRPYVKEIYIKHITELLGEEI